MRESLIRVLGAGASALLVAGSCAAASPGAAPASSEEPASAAPGAALRGGQTRTADEVARCREEETKRLRRERPRPVAEPPAAPVALRARPADLPENACQDIATRWNFYAATNVERGCFVNVFADISDYAVVDRATGLMWQRQQSPKYLSFSAAKRHVDELNRKRFAGYSDWRLPTVEEFLSLLESDDPYDNVHIDTLVFGRGSEWWTADRFSKPSGAWIVDVMVADCRPAYLTDEAYVRAVRTAR